MIQVIALAFLIFRLRKRVNNAFLVMIILYFLNSAIVNIRYLIKPWARSRLLLVAVCISISELIMYFFTFQLKLLKE